MTTMTYEVKVSAGVRIQASQTMALIIKITGR